MQRGKNGTQKQKFPIKKTSVTVCAQGGRRLHGHTRIVEHRNTPLSNCWVNDVLVEATTLLDETLFQVVDVEILLRVAGARPTPHSPRDLGRGYWAATATVR